MRILGVLLLLSCFLLTSCLKKSPENLSKVSKRVGVPFIWATTAGFNGSPSVASPEDNAKK